ncbi:unnamed protein product, partial [Acidithrix sp. C25]
VRQINEQLLRRLFNNSERTTTTTTPNANYQPKAKVFEKWSQFETFKSDQSENYFGPICVYQPFGYY